MSFVCIWYFDSEKLTQKSDYTAAQETYVGYEVSKACRYHNVKEGMGLSYSNRQHTQNRSITIYARELVTQ